MIYDTETMTIGSDKTIMTSVDRMPSHDAKEALEARCDSNEFHFDDQRDDEDFERCLSDLEKREDRGLASSRERTLVSTGVASSEYTYVTPNVWEQAFGGSATKTFHPIPVRGRNCGSEREVTDHPMPSLIRQLSSFSLDGIDVNEDYDFEVPEGFGRDIAPSGHRGKSVHSLDSVFRFSNTGLQPVQQEVKPASRSIGNSFLFNPTPEKQVRQLDEFLAEIPCLARNDSYDTVEATPEPQPDSSRNEQIIIQTPHGPALLLPQLSRVTTENSYRDISVITPTPTLSSITSTNRKFQRWSDEEDEALRHAIMYEGSAPYNWKKIATKYFGHTRSGQQCKGRWTKSLQPGLVLGGWQPEEDELIRNFRLGGMKWSEIAEHLHGRIGEHVRDRYVNFLDPNLKRSPWTKEEDAILFEEQANVGNKWSVIAKMLPGRSENSVKNRWHNAKMTQRRIMRKHASERTRQEQSKRARQHHAKPLAFQSHFSIEETGIFGV